METSLFKVGDVVTDKWWKEKVGKVTKVYSKTLHVEWSDGDKWIYDKDHLVFLVKRRF